MESLPPTWEACKENVIPIKRGRSAKGLSEVLKEPTCNDNDINKLREQVFEDAIANSTSSKQLLDTYISYYKWYYYIIIIINGMFIIIIVIII